jgi:hypothetical protein
LATELHIGKLPAIQRPFTNDRSWPTRTGVVSSRAQCPLVIAPYEDYQFPLSKPPGFLKLKPTPEIFGSRIIASTIAEPMPFCTSFAILNSDKSFSASMSEKSFSISR